MRKKDVTNAETATSPTLLQVLSSVCAAFFGVQSSHNRRRDFTHGNPWQFVVIGCLMTGLVVLSFYMVVRLVLHFSVPG